MKKDTWLLVANSSLARLFKMVNRSKLEEIKIFEHPESRLHNIDLVSDKPGRDFESVGNARHALEPKTSPKQQECIIFAKSLADFLEEAYGRGEFEALYITANPSFLGLLRQNLYSNTSKSIKADLDKDLTQISIHELPSQLSFWS